jgi:hypothetical protein
MAMENLNLKQNSDILNLQMVIENLRHNQPGIFSTLSNNYNPNSFQELTKELALVVQNMNNQQRASNALGIELIQNDNEENFGNQEKKVIIL